MQATGRKIADAKHLIAIAAKAVAFGETSYLAAITGDIKTMIAAAASLAQEINPQG